MKSLELSVPHDSSLSILIVHTCWNVEIVDALVKSCLSKLSSLGCDRVDVECVPGAYELPQGVALHLSAKSYHAVIAIGVLIKGSTMHFEYISSSVCDGLMKVGLDTKTPVLLGVLTCLTEDQARERAGMDGGHSHGIDWATSAVHMGLLKQSCLPTVKRL